MLERHHRSQIFDKILKEVESGEKNSRLDKIKTQSIALAAASAANSDPEPLTEQMSTERKATRAFEHGDFETAAQEYARCLLFAVRSQTDPIELINLYLAHGSALSKSEKFEAASRSYDDAQSVFDNGASISMHEQRVDIETHRGLLALLQKRLSAAETHFIDAINHYEENCTVDAVKLAHLQSELGAVYTEAKHFDEAMEVILEAVTVLEGCNQRASEERMRIFQQLASIAFKKNEPTAAVNHLLEAYKWARDVNCPKEMVELEVTLATVYTQHGEFETARQWIETAIERQETTDETARWPLSLLYANLALMQTRPQSGAEPDSAVDCFSRSLDLQLTHLAYSPAA